MHAIWTFALAFWLFWFPQFTIPQHTGATASSGGSVTWTLIQHKNNFTCSGSTSGNQTCTISSLTSTVAHDGLILASAIYYNSQNASLAYSSASGDSTWTHCPSCFTRNTATAGNEEACDGAYIANATGGATSVSFVWSVPTTNSTDTDVEFYEVRRSTGTPSYDTSNNANASNAACSSCASPTLTLEEAAISLLSGADSRKFPPGPVLPGRIPLTSTARTPMGVLWGR